MMWKRIHGIDVDDPLSVLYGNNSAKGPELAGADTKSRSNRWFFVVEPVVPQTFSLPIGPQESRDRL
jgi:hypothetical protein